MLKKESDSEYKSTSSDLLPPNITMDHVYGLTGWLASPGSYYSTETGEYYGNKVLNINSESIVNNDCVRIANKISPVVGLKSDFSLELSTRKELLPSETTYKIYLQTVGFHSGNYIRMVKNAKLDVTVEANGNKEEFKDIFTESTTGFTAINARGTGTIKIEVTSYSTDDYEPTYNKRVFTFYRDPETGKMTGSSNYPDGGTDGEVSDEKNILLTMYYNYKGH